MGHTPPVLESIKTLSFATITNVLVQLLISYKFPAINLTLKAQIHTAIEDGK